MSDESNNTVEILESAPTEVKEIKQPSREDVKELGWSAREMDSAEKFGLIQKPKEKKETVKAEAEPTEPQETEKVVDEKPKNTWPDLSVMTPEQEKAFFEAFPKGTPQNGLVMRLKSERRDRQKAQAERDQILLEKKLLEDRIAALETKPKVEIDENGNEIDPDDKPLTKKQLMEYEREREEERRRREEETQKRSSSVVEAIREQEEYARSMTPDFDDTLKLAMDLTNNLDALISDTKTKKRIVELWREVTTKAQNADKLSLDDYTAADISYEIGKFHPNYGKKMNGPSSDTDGKQDPTKANGSLTPEQMKRIETNTQRRQSSASLSGGNGRRVIAAEDVTLKDVLKMTSEERQKFAKEHPDVMAKLRRG